MLFKPNDLVAILDAYDDMSFHMLTWISIPFRYSDIVDDKASRSNKVSDVFDTSFFRLTWITCVCFVRFGAVMCLTHHLPKMTWLTHLNIVMWQMTQFLDQISIAVVVTLFSYLTF